MNTCLICRLEFMPKRKEQRICSIPCRQKNNGAGRRGQRTGPQSKPYRTRVTKDGYLRMYAGRHPYANGRKEIHLHVMVMELAIGRAIGPNECVHHKNGNKTDNRLENLELMLHSEHSKHHATEASPMRARTSLGRYA